MCNTTQVQMTDTLKAVYRAWQNALMCLYMIVCFGLFMSSGPTESGHPALKSKDELWPTTVKKHTSTQGAQLQSRDTLFCASSACCMFYRGGNLSLFRLMVNSLFLDHTNVSSLSSAPAHPSRIFSSLCFLFSNSVRFLPLLFPYGSVHPTWRRSSIISRRSPPAPVSFSLSLFHIDMLPLPRPFSFHLAQLPLGRVASLRTTTLPIHTCLTHVCEQTINGLHSQSARGLQEYCKWRNTHSRVHAQTKAHIHTEYIHIHQKACTHTNSHTYKRACMNKTAHTQMSQLIRNILITLKNVF